MLQNFYKLSYTRGISQGRLSIEIYGNTGCGVFKRRVQNQKDFCLRINISTQRKSLNFENCILNGVLRSFSKSEAKPFLFLYSPFENSTTRIAITQICTHSYITLTVVAKNLNDKSGCQLWLNLAWAGLAVLFCRQMDFSNFSGLR